MSMKCVDCTPRLQSGITAQGKQFNLLRVCIWQADEQGVTADRRNTSRKVAPVEHKLRIGFSQLLERVACDLQSGADMKVRRS